MAHFAKIENSIVTDVIVADQEFVDSLPGQWVLTTYDTRGGIHYGRDFQPDGGLALRKNYAGIGFTYDEQRDAFIPPKPFPSWVLDENTCLWEPPTQMPNDGKIYAWYEGDQTWVEETPPTSIQMDGRTYTWDSRTKSWVEQGGQ